MAPSVGVSLWTDTLPDGEAFVAPADTSWPDQVDVVIVGGGFTGLWTAWYLATRDPGLRVHDPRGSGLAVLPALHKGLRDGRV